MHDCVCVCVCIYVRVYMTVCQYVSYVSKEFPWILAAHKYPILFGAAQAYDAVCLALTLALALACPRIFTSPSPLNTV